MKKNCFFCIKKDMHRTKIFLPKKYKQILPFPPDVIYTEKIKKEIFPPDGIYTEKIKKEIFPPDEFFK